MRNLIRFLIVLFLSASMAQAQVTPPALSLAMPVPSGALTVAFVNHGTVNSSQTTSPATDTSLNIASGNTDIALVVYITTVACIAPSAVTWNGTSMGTAVEQNCDGNTSTELSIYCLANPATGANTLSISWTGSMLQLNFVGAVYKNVHQAAPCKNGATANAQTVTTLTQNVTSAVGDMVTAMDGGIDVTSMSGTTLYSVTGQGFAQVFAQYTPGASGTVASTFTGSSGDYHTIGVDIAAGP